MTMRSLLLIALLVSGSAFADTYVHGYVRKDGTYVQPHYRSNTDGNFNNNWSTKGNYNPYTGQEGTRVQPNPGYNSNNSMYWNNQ